MWCYALFCNGNFQHAVKAKVVLCIAFNRKPITELPSVTCHKGSHSVSCHPTQVNASRLNPSQTSGIRFTYPGGMEGWVDLDVNYTPTCRWFTCPQTVTHLSSNHLIVNRPVFKPWNPQPLDGKSDTLSLAHQAIQGKVRRGSVSVFGINIMYRPILQVGIPYKLPAHQCTATWSARRLVYAYNTLSIKYEHLLRSAIYCLLCRWCVNPMDSCVIAFLAAVSLVKLPGKTRCGLYSFCCSIDFQSHPRAFIFLSHLKGRMPLSVCHISYCFRDMANFPLKTHIFLTTSVQAQF